MKIKITSKLDEKQNQNTRERFWIKKEIKGNEYDEYHQEYVQCIQQINSKSSPFDHPSVCRVE